MRRDRPHELHGRGRARRDARARARRRCAPATAASTCCTASTSSSRAGEVYALLGPNGAGKSTTLAVASGQIVPSLGEPAPLRTRRHGRDRRRARPRGRVPDPRRPGHLPEPDGHREPAHGDLHRDPLQRRPGPGLLAVPPARANAGARPRARSRAASSRCSPWPGRSPPTRPCCSSTSCRWGWRRSSSKSSTTMCAGSPPSGLSIVIVEQFAHEILGVADLAGIMLHGRIVETGTPAQIADELTGAYLGASASLRAHDIDSGDRAIMNKVNTAEGENAQSAGQPSARRCRPRGWTNSATRSPSSR